MQKIDLHCDNLMWHLTDARHSLQDDARQISERKLKEGGAAVQCFALFVPVEKGDTKEERVEDCYSRYNRLYQYYRKDLEENERWLKKATSAEEIEKNRMEGKISAVLTVEDGTFLGDRIKRIDEAYERGVRIFGLTWNTENEIGYANSDNRELHNKGLKAFGFEAVERMNELGMIVDVSHLNEGGFWDVAHCSRKPFIASHSCARALCDHQRNLTDEQIRAVGDAGGVIGVNLMPMFIKEQADYATIEVICRHFRHIADKGGLECVALGSDFDGMGDMRPELSDYGDYPKLTDSLAKEFTPGEIEKICSRNALRVFRECWNE